MIRKSFIIKNKLRFVESFQFLSSSFETLVKNLMEDNFKYLNQEFDNNVLDLVKQEEFYYYEYMSDFKKFRKQLPSKKRFIILWLAKKLMTKNMNTFLMLGINLK